MKRDWVEPGDCRPLWPSENIRAVVLKMWVLKSAVLASSGNLLERLTHWSPTLWALITLWIVPRLFCMVSISVLEKGLGWSLQPAALQLLCITGSELGEEGRIVTRCDAANKDGDWWEKDTQREKYRPIAIEIPNLLETVTQDLWMAATGYTYFVHFSKYQEDWSVNLISPKEGQRRND